MKFHLTCFDNKSTFSHFVDYNMEKLMKYNGKERDFLDRTEQVVCHFSWAHHHLLKQVRSRLLCNGLCFCKIFIYRYTRSNRLNNFDRFCFCRPIKQAGFKDKWS